ncbi:MAG: chloride channel protein [Synergistaceae bacterium]|nr:chloride channel protein [Synergistaceae bacterium]
MRNDIVRDQIWLFSSLTKWVFFAVIAGLAVGTATAAFLYILDAAINFIDFVNTLGNLNHLLILPGFLFSFYAVHIFTNDEKVDVEKSIHEKAGAVSLTAIPVRLVSTVVTIAVGGSTGKEGPSAQIGAGIMYALSRFFRLDDYDMKRLVIVGVASGISAVFGTPITGAIFGVEILYAGQMYYDVLLPAFIGGIISRETAAFWGAGHLPEFLIDLPMLAPNMIFMSVLAGMFFGIVSLLHIECLRTVRFGFNKLKIPQYTKPLLGAAIMLLITAVFGPYYLGLGDELITHAINGETTQPFAFILKSFAMAVTLGCGGNGGVLTPTLVIGATSGTFFSSLVGGKAEIFSALGLVSVLAGSTNTPIASTILAMELFGAPIAPFAGIACTVSYVMTGHRSLYPGQLMLRPKAKTFVKRKNADGVEEIVGRFEGIPTSKVVNFYAREVKKEIKKNVMGKKK